MNDTTNTIVIPDELKEQHGELIEMIMETESMDDSERQYWVDLLPIMTPEQIQNLYDILDNEKKKLAEIDSYYDQKVDEIELDEKAEKQAQERKMKMQQLQSAEIEAEKSDEELEQQLLSELDNL